MQRKTNTFLAGLGLMVAGILVSSNYSVESVSAYSATITTSNSIELDITPNGNGTSIHSESINVQSDCRAGYNLTIATPEGSSLYKYSNNTQADTASFTAVDGTSALSSSNNTNKWGYTLTSNPTSSTVFSPLSSTAAVLKTTSQTASPSADINDTFSINYGAKVDNTVDAGIYKMANNGSIVYYLTMDTTCIQYTVAFNPNGGTGTMDNQPMQIGEPAVLTSSESLTAPTGGSYTDADNNTITGDADKLWTFWGWNTSADGTGDWYKDKEEVTDLSTVGTTITLYAQWKQATLADMVAGTPIDSEKVIDHDLMQDMKPEICWNSPITTAENAPAATLKDYRGKVTTGNNPESPEQYNVSKLADGLCWMTTNLNLGRASGGPNNDGTITLTSEDTDLATDTTFTLPSGDTTSYISTTNLAKIRLTNNSSLSDNGVFYTWSAAVANTTSISSNPTTSICPKNWDLPATNQYSNLSTKSSYSSSNRPTAAPSSFLATGGFTDGATFYGPTSYGHYWSSTSSSSTVAYYTYSSTSSLSTGSSTGTNTARGGNKYYRKNLRCIASQGTVTINYDGNDNDGGSMSAQTNVEINSSSLTSNTFTRTHYVFKNWNTVANGSGTTIANTAALSALGLKPGDTITLYAQWTPQRQIIYNDNCGYNNAGCVTNEDTTGTSSWTNAGSNITLGNNTYFTSRPGYAITSWNTARDGSGTSYNVSTSYSIPSSLSAPDQVTLYAMWSPALTINFNSNGGGGTMTSQLISENTSNTLKSNSFTAPSGNYFIGWMTEESRTTNTVIYANQATYTTPATVTPGDSITLYAKWGPRYTIVYNGNNATGGSMISSGTELKHASINEGNTVNLYAPNYYKTNYGFVGWSPSSTATVGGADPIYGPNESISAPAYDKYGQEISGTKTITLYAIWLEADSTKTMQTFDLTDCQSMTQTAYDSTTGNITAPAGSIIALKDQRDNNVYTIARLADGNCWMIENLRLDAAGTVGNNQTNPSVTNESLAQGYGGVFTGLDSTENSNFANTTNATPNNLYNSTNIAGTYTGYRFPRYNNNNTNTTLTASYNGTGSGTYYNWYSYGNYYTWAAAMANTTHYDSAIGTSGSESTNTSICPANWVLPTSGATTKDFGYLSQQYGGSGDNQVGTGTGDVMSKRFRSFPNNFLYSGYINASSASGRGSSGSYWSRSVYNYNYAYYLLLNSTFLYPSRAYYHYYGYNVRCLVDYTYTIKYDGNNATGGSMISDGKELKHAGLLGGETLDLYSPNYYKTGYGFAGWSMDADAWDHFTDNDSTNDPVIYGPMETITAPAHPGYHDLTLYAIWVPAEEDGNNDPVYLQDFDNTSCSNLTSTTYDSATGVVTVNKNSIVALTDKRDGNVYTVARLADGNCWMTENLRLEAANTVGSNQFDSSITNESLSQGYGGVFTGLDSTENSNFTYSTNATPNNLYNSSNITGDYTSYRFPRYNNNNTNANLTASYNGTGNSTYYSWYSYGNYYTWAAAIANTAQYNSPNATDINGKTSETANTSLCPAGWKLPRGGDQSREATNDFWTLVVTSINGGINPANYDSISTPYYTSTSEGGVVSNKLRAYPNNFLYSGHFLESSPGLRGEFGSYWSSTTANQLGSHNLRLDKTSVYPGTSGLQKVYGLSVRCLISGS